MPVRRVFTGRAAQVKENAWQGIRMVESARMTQTPPGSNSLWVYLSNWSSSKVPIAIWKGTDLSLPTFELEPHCRPHVLASWSIDPSYKCYIPGAPARLHLPKGHSALFKLDQPGWSRVPDHIYDEWDIKIIRSSLQHLSPTFDSQTVDIYFNSLSDIAHSCLRRSRPLIIVASPNRPLGVWSVTSRFIPNIKIDRSLALGFDQGKGKAIEIALTQQEHEIPQGSRHFRISHIKFGGLSIAFRHEVDAWNPPEGVPQLQSTAKETKLTSTVPEMVPVPPGPDQLGQILYTENKTLVKDAVEIKRVSEDQRVPSGTQGPWRADVFHAAWFTGIRKVCVATLESDNNVSAMTIDISEDIARWSKENQQPLKSLHGLLNKLRAEIPQDRTAAYILLPLNTYKNIARRSWELYEVDLDDPLVKRRVQELQGKFPLRNPGVA